MHVHAVSMVRMSITCNAKSQSVASSRTTVPVTACHGVRHVSSCRDVDGVLRRANQTEFGLAAGVFTRDINKVQWVG